MFSNLPATDSCCLRTTWLSRRNQCAGLARLNIQLIYLTSHFGGETGWDGCWGEASSSIRSATAVWFIETWVDLRNHVSFSVGRSAGASRGGHAGSWLVHSTASHKTRVWKTLGSHSRIPHQAWKGKILKYPFLIKKGIVGWDFLPIVKKVRPEEVTIGEDYSFTCRKEAQQKNKSSPHRQYPRGGGARDKSPQKTGRIVAGIHPISVSCGNSYPDPIPVAMQAVRILDLATVDINWKMLTVARPTSKQDDEFFTKYYNLKR